MTAASRSIDVDEDSLNSITTDVWSTFVAEDVVVMPLGSVPPCGDADRSSRIVIEGDATAVVVVRCDPQSAAALARRMFRLDDADEPDSDEIDDALGEMANVVGGNVKSLAVGESRLTLPVVGASSETETDGMPQCAAEIIWPDGRATLTVGLPADFHK